jgi:hypothetical protein
MQVVKHFFLAERHVLKWTFMIFEIGISVTQIQRQSMNKQMKIQYVEY